MTASPIAMLIATRLLKVRRSEGEVDLPIRIFAPEGNGKSWGCKYEIEWPDGLETMTAWGSDSVQAIVVALQMIGAGLYTSNYHKAGALSLEGPGRGYGFPVPSNISDLLEGDDASFF